MSEKESKKGQTTQNIKNPEGDPEAQKEALRKLEEKGKSFLENAPDEKEVKLKRQPEEMTPEEAQEKAESLEERKARIAQVLSRGFLQSRLALAEKVPKDRLGFWIREREEDISRIQALGGRLEERETVGHKPQAGDHDAGDNRVRLGDVVLMSIRREDHELIQQVRRDQKMKRSHRAKDEYLENARKNPDIPVISS